MLFDQFLSIFLEKLKMVTPTKFFLKKDEFQFCIFKKKILFLELQHFKRWSPDGLRVTLILFYKNVLSPDLRKLRTH